MDSETLSKAGVLCDVARNYVIKGLGEKNFDAIPYDERVILRAPKNPGGSENHLIGKKISVKNVGHRFLHYWGKVNLIDSFVNEDCTAATVEFHWEILKPACALRVIDRFVINEEGTIIEQENILDPRDLTRPGV